MKPITHTRIKHFGIAVCCVQACAVMLASLMMAPDVFSQQRASIEEVLITAQKREESLQEAPLSITALTAEELDVNHVIEFGSAVNLVPNVVLRKQSASHANYAFGVRGVTSGETQLAIDSVIAVYVDGAYLGRLTGSAFDISDTERVEILRGPQGTLYGRNATGGAINIVSAKPDRELRVRNHFRAGERGFWRNQFTLNTGAAKVFGGELMVRANYSKWNHRGLLRNEATNSNGSIAGFIGDQDSEASKLSVRYESDRFTADFVYDRSTKLGNAQHTQFTNLNDFAPPVPGTVRGGDTTGLYRLIRGESGQDYVSEERLGAVSKYYDQPETSDIEGHALTLQWDLPGGYTFKSITSVRDWDSGIPSFGTDFGSFIVDSARLTALRTADGAQAPQPPTTPMTPDMTDMTDMTPPDTSGPMVPPQTSNQMAGGPHIAVDFLNLQPDILKTGGVVDEGQAVSLFRASRQSVQTQLTQEFQLNGTSFNNRLDWVLGLYYFEEEADEDNQQFAALPGSTLPFVGGVASALDAEALLGLSQAAGLLPAGAFDALTAGEAQVRAAVTEQTAPGVDAGVLTTDQQQAIIEAEVARYYGEQVGTDELGATIRGRGSRFLCSGVPGTAADLGTALVTDLSAMLGQPAGTVTIANACYGTTVLGGVDIFRYGTENKSTALYWHGRISIIDPVTLAIGVRYTEDDRSAYLRYTPINRGARTDARSDWENFTWDLTVDWQINPEINIYGRIANSYRAGGFNARTVSAQGFQDPFDAEDVSSVEVGIKTQFWRDKIRFNASIYSTEITDAQVATFTPRLLGAASVISNAGELSLQGVEVEFLIIPFTGLSVGLNYGAIDAEYDAFAEGNAILMAGLGVDDEGNPNEPVVPYSPESNWSVFVDYQFPTYSWGQLGLRLDSNYSDAFTISPLVQLDDPANLDTERTLVNFSVSLNEIPVKHGDFSVSLWSRNITNEAYREFVIPFGAYSVATYGELRSSGLDIVYTY